MENNVFKRRLITKLAISAAFLALTIGAIVAVNIVNKDVIAPNEGFITNALCHVDTGGAKNSMGERLAVEIEQEGIVLAKNDDNVLPLSKDNKVINVFGYDAIQWVISNSGSGSAGAGSSQKTWGLLEALDEKGVTYNQEVINYYKNWATPRDRGIASYGQTTYNNVYRLTNPSLSNNSDFRTVYDNASSDTDTAIVVIGRWGGEHIDPPHTQINNYNSAKSTNPDRGYLEITEEEEELLTEVGQDYDKVIVIINSVNTMQMDFMTNIDGLDACLLVGPTGTVGARAIPQVLYGDINPSGRTADTWPMNHRYNPAYWTVGYFSHGEGNTYPDIPAAAELSNRNAVAGNGYGVFADYLEGIYVGYKWYETAYAEGYWEGDPYNGYDNVVAYPFGHGLSYTTFSWELNAVEPGNNSEIIENEEIKLQVRVTNTGSRAGRDVVEVYLAPQYYEGEIEKSAVQLVGFKKTKLLMPGENEIVPITVKTRDFLVFDSYDDNDNNHAGYELDRGTYELKLMTSAHVAKAGAGTVKYTVSNTINVDEDPETGNEVKPLFTNNDLGDTAIDGVSCDGKSINEPVNFMTRENFAPLLTSINPNRSWNPGIVTCDDNSKPTAYSTKMANDWDNATVDVFGKATKQDSAPTFGKNTGQLVFDSNNQITELGKILAQDFDAPEWEAVLDQVTWDEASTVYKESSYDRPGFTSIGMKSHYYDAEGASQVAGDLDGGRRNTAYPDPCVQGQCWNEYMCYQFGLSESKDMILSGKDYLYGPASNIHRSPYGGRHAEYHSEDGFLASRCLSNVTKGLADGGKNGFIKHFALNDTEYHRVGLFVWCTEQAVREIYLKPFETAIKEGNCVAVMSSFNRIGAVWTGGSQALLQGVLRNEWGFKGMTITDYTENGTLQDSNQMLRAGGNYVLSSSNFNEISQNNATNRYKWQLRQSAKHIIWANVKVAYTNFVYNSDASNKAIVSSSSKAPWVWWKPLLHCAEALVIVSLAFGCLAALMPSDPEFRAHLFKKKSKDEGAE